MKAKSLLAPVKPLITMVALSCLATAGWSAETLGMDLPAQEDLGVDIVDGATNKIVRVSGVTPASVFVLYEGECRGRRILRQDLPPQLKAKYSYDPAKVAEYQKRQIELAAQQAVAQRVAMRDALRHQEAEMVAEIAMLEKQDAEAQKEKSVLRSLPPGNGRRVRLAQINNNQENIRERISQLRALLQQVRAQSDSMP